MVEFFGRRKIRDMFVKIFSYDQELIEQGDLSKAIKVAKKMIDRGDSIGEIVELTDLSVDMIKELKDNASS